jgi:hypothetical protein
LGLLPGLWLRLKLILKMGLAFGYFNGFWWFFCFWIHFSYLALEILGLGLGLLCWSLEIWKWLSFFFFFLTFPIVLLLCTIVFCLINSFYKFNKLNY